MRYSVRMVVYSISLLVIMVGAIVFNSLFTGFVIGATFTFVGGFVFLILGIVYQNASQSRRKDK